MATNGYKNASLLEHLSEDLGKQVQTLCDYFRSAGLVQPSFDRSTPVVVLPEEAPQQAHNARELLMDYALQIFQLASGPSEYLGNVITGYHYMSCVQWLSHFKIFSLVPLDGSISYTELAGLAHVSEARLKSVARMAITNRLFVESSPGHIAHSAISALLITNENLHDQTVWMSDIIAPTISAMVDAHSKWPADTEANHSAFNKAFDTDLPLYQYLGQQPELYKLFGRVMKTLASSPKSDLKHLVGGLDWAGLGKGLVVDVGGNIGHSCVALAKAFPELNFIVQDFAHVVVEGEQHINSLNDSSLSERIKFQTNDFFESQPVVGADVYLLRQIFHNWDFDHSAKILSNLVSAMKEGSHIVIMDFVLPDPGSVPSVNERVLRSRDLGMMQLFNGLERDLEDWSAIFAKVNPRLKIKSVSKPFGSSMSVLDLVLSDE